MITTFLSIIGLRFCSLLSTYQWKRWLVYTIDSFFQSFPCNLNTPCFNWVIETRVKVWENEKCCGNTTVCEWNHSFIEFSQTFTGVSILKQLDYEVKTSIVWLTIYRRLDSSRFILKLDRNTDNMFSISFRKHRDKKRKTACLLTLIIKM